MGETHGIAPYGIHKSLKTFCIPLYLSFFPSKILLLSGQVQGNSPILLRRQKKRDETSTKWQYCLDKLRNWLCGPVLLSSLPSLAEDSILDQSSPWLTCIAAVSLSCPTPVSSQSSGNPAWKAKVLPWVIQATWTTAGATDMIPACFERLGNNSSLWHQWHASDKHHLRAHTDPNGTSAQLHQPITWDKRLPSISCSLVSTCVYLVVEMRLTPLMLQLQKVLWISSCVQLKWCTAAEGTSQDCACV